jgi:aspartyl-tRNA(Asn)/glutamyl-tRNA(Gln) amidotransferase subunit A
MDEFGMGSSNENSAYGPVLNPWNSGCVPGGSSGGSAVAVASGTADAALGSETGGSVRQPASFNGLVGVKPSYGRVSRYGLVAYASSLDQIGPLTRSVDDAALMMECIAGPDSRDSTTVNAPVPEYRKSIGQDIKGMKIGIPPECFGEGLDPVIREGIETVIAKIEKEGGSILPVSLSLTDYAIAAYYVIAAAEASSNLARFDAVRYGFRAESSGSLSEMYRETRSKGFSEEVTRRIMLGLYVLSSGYYEAYYRKAQKIRRRIKEEFDNAFETIDIILTPTTPTTAFRMGEKLHDPLAMYLSDVYTVSANLSGICAISIPAGINRNTNLPYGVQLMANAFGEPLLFRVGHFLEQFCMNEPMPLTLTSPGKGAA